LEAALGQLSNTSTPNASRADPAATQTAPRITVVVPVLNAMRFLPQTVPRLLDAARNTRGVEVLYVDNGSIDGSQDYLKSLESMGLQVHNLDRAPNAAARNLSAAARNFGARQSDSQFLSFLDADCIVGEDYFNQAVAILESTRAAATGCETEVPSDPHWIEATWHDLHYVGRERDVHYLNSANFFIDRQAFDDVGGFREDLSSGADAEIGQRLTNAGYRIHESPSVGAVHLGNPKSVREFYRRNVWQSTGMFGTVNWHRIDKPTAMMTVHLLATIGGFVILIAGPFILPLRFFLAVLLQVVAPGVTVAYRALQTGRARRLVAGISLYWLYYCSRVHALGLVVAGRTHRYSKQ
jgi:GT2 family glycosyltransferase